VKAVFKEVVIRPVVSESLPVFRERRELDRIDVC
jgi:hypothetical protein